jgi:aminoglycoside phosphotransferase
MDYLALEGELEASFARINSITASSAMAEVDRVLHETKTQLRPMEDKCEAEIDRLREAAKEKKSRVAEAQVSPTPLHP